MGGARYDWWRYAKSMVKRYPKYTTEAETRAVEAALQKTKELECGDLRLAVVDMVLCKQTHTIAGAALQVHSCERNACQWHADFIKLVAKEFRCDGLF